MAREPMQMQAQQNGSRGRAGAEEAGSSRGTENERAKMLRDELLVRLDEDSVNDSLMQVLEQHAGQESFPQAAAQVMVSSLNWLESQHGRIENTLSIKLLLFMVNYVLSEATNAGLIEKPGEDVVQQMVAQAIKSWAQAHPERIDVTPEELKAMADRAGVNAAGGGVPQGQQGMEQPAPTQGGGGAPGQPPQQPSQPAQGGGLLSRR